MLNKEQKMAVEADGNVVVTACAGSGKTRVLTSRIGRLIRDGVAAESILCVTFTNEAARNMVRRASEEFGDAVLGVTAGTFHSVCAKWLRKWAGLVGRTYGYAIVEARDVPDIIRMVSVDERERFGRGFPSCDDIAAVISGARNTDMPIKAYAVKKAGGGSKGASKCVDFLGDVENIARKYDEFKRANDLMDFDDLLVLVRQVFRARPRIAEAMASKYREILVDEYQDTNLVQQDILLALEAQGANLFVVGDEAQSLYAFRGAEPKNIRELPRLTKRPCAKIVLGENYRSAQEVLDAPNGVMARCYTGEAVNMRGQFRVGFLPVLHTTADDEIAAESAARIFMSAKGSAAILYRASRSAAPVEARLALRGVGYVKRGGPKLTEKAGIRDFIALMRCVLNQRDKPAHFRALQVIPGIGERYALELAEGAARDGRRALTENRFGRHFFAPALRDLAKALAAWDGSALDGARIAQERYVRYRQAAIDASRGNEKTLGALIKDFAEAKPLIERLVELAADAPSLPEFIENLTLDPPSDEADGQRVLSTIHSAKGLEWDTVIVLDCVEGKIPKAAEGDEDARQDDLRCFYVALTRARKELHLFAPRLLTQSGRECEVSSFLEGSQHLFRCVND